MLRICPMRECDLVKQYDLEDRTFNFAQLVIGLVRRVPKDIANVQIAKQLVRSSGSVGANYIEANESLSKKDFLMRIKICRKEAKESCYWLRLIQTNGDEQGSQRKILVQESTELMKIFGSILEKSK